MDLRSRVRTPADIREAKALIAQGHFIYQPFRITDDLEVGGGYEFVNRRPGAGMVYWPAYEQEKERFPGSPLKTIDPALVTEFRAANDFLRSQYNGFIDQVCERIPDIRAKSVADIGCFNGYMPASFSLRGARDAVGYDQDDRSGCFRFLNRLLGTRSRFIHAGYDLAGGTIPGCPAYDVVISMSVLQHMTEPFRHLHFLRSITREALFLMTNAWDDDEYLVRYGEPNAIFPEFEFPWCFDSSIYLSEKLLRKALEKAGFTRIVKLENRSTIGIRHAETRGSHDYANEGGHRQKLTAQPLLCFVDGPATGAQASLKRGSRRPESSRTLALIRKILPQPLRAMARKVFPRRRD
jgi:hypothetical protein